MKATVLGTGIMGSGIASVLATHGIETTAWNRTIDRALALREQSVHVEPVAANAVSQADVIFIVVYDSDSVLDVLEQCVDAAPRHAIWVQMATIGAAGAKQVAAFAAQHGITLVETMMMGSKDQANSGQLILIGGGDQRGFDAARPALDAISKKLVWCGPQLGDGTAVKLACNLWLGCITAAACQSLEVLERQGVDPHLFLDVISGATSDSPYAHIKGDKAISGDFSPQFEVVALKKDLDLMHDVMVEVGFRDDLLVEILGLYDQADAGGHTHDDISAVATVFQ